MSSRPHPAEFAPYCAKYIALVPDGDFIANFDSETVALFHTLNCITEQKSLHRYAPNKWSIREMFLHVSDVERILSYRALRFARGDQTPAAGFDPAAYVTQSNADQRTWKSILEEFAAVRGATQALFRNLPLESWTRAGQADSFPSTVRSNAFTLAGHAIHHRKILSDRYQQPQ